MSHYTHLTIDEREKARGMREQGLSFGKIGVKLSRSKSTVIREFARNTSGNGEYSAHRAQKLYEKRNKNCGPKPKLKSPEIREYVEEKLELRWSPEQIAGRAKLEKKKFSISYNTIYRAVDKGILPKALKKKMRFKWKYKKRKSDDKRGKIADTTSIHERSAGANSRKRYGHWESDTVLGKRKTGCIATHVERKSGYLVAFYLADRRDGVFTSQTAEAFKAIPDKLKRSFTVDNGNEFTDHKALSEYTGMKVYFCDPFSPWQRGTNENTNGLLRQFFPKGSSFSDAHGDRLDSVISLLNNRPRKRLGFKSPKEVLEHFF